jgi:hypothetical protein
MPAMLALALLAGAAQATAPQAPNAPILVEGRNARVRASEYVEKVLPGGFVEQFARYENPLCPKAVGLPAAIEKEVTDRIRLVAKAAQIDVANGSCTPNLIVIVTPDKKATIDILRKSRPLYVDGVSPDMLKRLAASPQPFLSWQVTEMIGNEGMPIGKGNNMPRPNPSKPFDGDFSKVFVAPPPSRLRANAKPQILASIVTVETKALNDVTSRQLADFALVRAMLPLEDRDGNAPASSILSLFNPGVTPEGGPQSVTWLDIAFLKALASTRSDIYADIQKSEIREQMVNEIKASAADR